MQVKQLDHVNIQTANVDSHGRVYGRVLNIAVRQASAVRLSGARGFTAAAPVVHLVGVKEQPAAGYRLEHFALSASASRISSIV
jgi:hypothetical protein